MLGGYTVSRIARWDGVQWLALGRGLNGSVSTLTTYNGALIAGGAFTAAGTEPVAYIASWDGQSWHPLGSGMNGVVWAVTVYNGRLIAGGDFTEAGGTPRGMDVVVGEAVWIQAHGSIVFAPDASSNTDGCRLHLGADSCQCRAFSDVALVPNAVHGSLVGRINGGTPFCVGHDLFLQCADSGPVEFAYNDQIGDYFDNSGFFHVSLCLNPCGVPAGLPEPGSPVNKASSPQLTGGGPNPVTRGTMVSLTLPSDGHVEVDVVDLLGRRVASLVDGDLTAGTQQVRWDGASGSTRQVAAGAYYLRVRTAQGELSRKVVLVK